MHVWNTVQKIKAMSNVSKVHYTDFNVLNAMYVCMFFPTFDIFDIQSITALRCIWSIFDIFNIESITFKENENDISNIFDMSHTLYSVQITM